MLCPNLDSQRGSRQHPRSLGILHRLDIKFWTVKVVSYTTTQHNDLVNASIAICHHGEIDHLLCSLVGLVVVHDVALEKATEHSLTGPLPLGDQAQPTDPEQP